MINFSANNNAQSQPAINPYRQLNLYKPISHKNNSNNQQHQDHNVVSKVLALTLAAVALGGIIYAAKKGKIFPLSNKSAAAPSKGAKETTTLASTSQPSEKGKSSGILGILADGITEISDFFKKNFSGKSEIKASEISSKKTTSPVTAVPPLLKPDLIKFPKNSDYYLKDRKKIYGLSSFGEPGHLVYLADPSKELLYFNIPEIHSGFRDSQGEVLLMGEDPKLGFKDPIMEYVVNDFLMQINDRNLVANAKDEKSYLNVFQFLHQYVKMIFPSDNHAFYTMKEGQPTNPLANTAVPLSEIIRNRDGVCRHKSALTKHLLDHLQANGLNNIEASTTLSNGAHTYNRFTINLNGTPQNIQYDALDDALPSFV